MSRQLYILAIGIACFAPISGCSEASSNTPTLAAGQEPTHSEQLSPTSSQPEEDSCARFQCWAGITPGVTTFAEAETLLIMRYGVDRMEMRQNHIEWQAEQQIDGSQNGWLRSDQRGIVHDINVFFLADRLQVEALIEQVGEPSEVYIARAVSSEVNCAGALLFYRDIGFIAYLYPENGFLGVEPAQSIYLLTLLTPEEAQSWTITDHFQLEWEGYADYCALATQ